MRLRLDPTCLAVKVREGIVRPSTTLLDASLDKTWRIEHAETCVQCRDYLALDAELVLGALLNNRKAHQAVVGDLVAAGFGCDIVELAMAQLREAKVQP